MSFRALGLSAELLRAVAERGYTLATPIQRQAIPTVLDGRDILAGAQTGTGKTAAFALPMLQRLSDGAALARRVPRALVLTPTRELAVQVGESFRAYGRHLPLRAAPIFGGVGINPQIATLRRGVDIVVATPGRLLDHAGQGNIDLTGIEILVLDEADRMLDMGFIHDIRRVLRLLPERRQNLLFSATYSREIEQLAAGLLRQPQLIEVARRNTAAETVKQLVHPVAQSNKRALLSHLIHLGGWEQVLVFTRTKHGANRLAQQLERDGISAAAIHGNKSQSARTRALADFKSAALRTLVGTDIAARGLDIGGLPHVVNFELPNVPEDYVHRIGRTGRAGADGTAVSLVSPAERGLLADIERLLGRRIETRRIDGFGDSETAGDALASQEPRRPRPAVAGPGPAKHKPHRRSRPESHQPARQAAGQRTDEGAPRPRGRGHSKPARAANHRSRAQ